MQRNEYNNVTMSYSMHCTPRGRVPCRCGCVCLSSCWPCRCASSSSPSSPSHGPPSTPSPSYCVGPPSTCWRWWRSPWKWGLSCWTDWVVRGSCRCIIVWLYHPHAYLQVGIIGVHVWVKSGQSCLSVYLHKIHHFSRCGLFCQCLHYCTAACTVYCTAPRNLQLGLY